MLVRLSCERLAERSLNLWFISTNSIDDTEETFVSEGESNMYAYDEIRFNIHNNCKGILIYDMF